MIKNSTFLGFEAVTDLSEAALAHHSLQVEVVRAEWGRLLRSIIQAQSLLLLLRTRSLHSRRVGGLAVRLTL